MGWKEGGGRVHVLLKRALLSCDPRFYMRPRLCVPCVFPNVTPSLYAVCVSTCDPVSIRMSQSLMSVRSPSQCVPRRFLSVSPASLLTLTSLNPN